MFIKVTKKTSGLLTGNLIVNTDQIQTIEETKEGTAEICLASAWSNDEGFYFETQESYAEVVSLVWGIGRC